MPRVIVSEDTKAVEPLLTELTRNDFACFVSDATGIDEQLATQKPDLELLELDNPISVSSLCRAFRQRNLPTITIARLETIGHYNVQLEVDDFIINPFDMRELVLRINRLLKKNARSDADIIRYGDLTIDTARCEVTIAGFSKILTFKEYELLKFLAGKPGHVFTRNVLLDRVWGHEYFGGDRTVDVHIKRLRSKIEDSNDCQIETVRKIGYRFSINI